MGRSFRYYGKKRGNRRTGSPVLASAGEALFFSVFLGLGCIGMVILFSTIVVPEWRVNHEFIETTCKILDKQLEEKPGEDGPLYRPQFKIEYGVTTTLSYYDIHQTWSNNRENVLAILDRYVVCNPADPSKCQRYPCWYDPADPYNVVLERGYRWWVWLVFTIPVSFVAIGAGGLVYTMLHWGRSAERRAALAQRVQERDFFGSNESGQVFPYVPAGTDMTNSPGTKLRFRLPMTASPGLALLGLLVFCILWDGLVAAFIVCAVKDHLAGKHDWFLTVFLIPLALVGIGAIVVFIRQILVTTGIGPTLLEISDHPLLPGKPYQFFLSQSGRLTFHTLHVFLTCEELATYRQGTNTRTETQEVFRSELFHRNDFAIENGLPFEVEFDLEMPDDVMHSFRAPHNEVNWAITVEGEAAGWPKYCRTFPVIVRPVLRTS